MNCLIDYIGLQQCNDSTPDSGVFINSLPGISTELLQKIADGDNDTYNNVWDSIQTIAALRFKTAVLTKLRANFNLKTVREKFDWKPADSVVTEAAAAEHRGVLMQFEFGFMTFQAIRIAKLYYRAPALAAGLQFTFMDIDGAVLHSKTADVVEGLNTITIDRTFVTKSLFIGVDATANQTLDTEFTQADASCFCQSIRAFCPDCVPTIDGYTVATGTNDFVKTSGNTHGIGVLGYVVCDYDSIVCNNKEIFASAWLYLLGNQIMLEVLGSDRVGKPTTVDRKQFEELRDFYHSEFDKTLAEAVEGIHINVDKDCCIECGGNPRRVEWLP